MDWFNYLILAAGAAWVISKVRRSRKKARMMQTLSFVTPFLAEHGLPPGTLSFSSYDEDALCIMPGSTVLVGMGTRGLDKKIIGFAIEVSPDGQILESAFLLPGPASYHVAAAREARLKGQTLIQSLVARSARLEADQGANAAKVPSARGLLRAAIMLAVRRYDDGDLTHSEFVAAAMGSPDFDISPFLRSYESGDLTKAEFIDLLLDERLRLGAA